MSKKKPKKGKENQRKTINKWITITSAIVLPIIFFLYNYRIDILNDKHQAEIMVLETKISSIERNIGENDYFDVKNLFVSDGQGNKPLFQSNFVPSGNFYADTTSTEWFYKEISPISYIKNELDIDPLEFQIGRKSSISIDSILSSQEFISYRREYKFHQWKYKDSIILERDNINKILNTTINVFIIDKEVAKLAFDVLNRNLKSEKVLVNSLDIDTTLLNRVVKTAKKQYSKNSSALMFNIFINGMIYNSLLKGDLIELKNVQKKSDVFYTKYTSEIEAETNPIFETSELFFAEKNNKVYIVIIRAFDLEPIIPSKKATAINKWLFSLQFL